MKPKNSNEIYQWEQTHTTTDKEAKQIKNIMEAAWKKNYKKL